MTTLDIAGVVLAVLLATGGVLDVFTRRLPNVLCLATAIAGVAVLLITSTAHGAISGLSHGLLALIVGAVLFRVGVVGGGDAKFYAALATWFPLTVAPRLLLAVSLSGLVLFFAWFVARRLAGRKVVRNASSPQDRFPYGIAIAAGGLVAWALQIRTPG